MEEQAELLHRHRQGAIQPQVLLFPQPRLADSAADILARAPATSALVGTPYGAHLALEIALAAPDRVSSLWLMGCDGSPSREGGPDIAAVDEARKRVPPFCAPSPEELGLASLAPLTRETLIPCS